MQSTSSQRDEEELQQHYTNDVLKQIQVNILQS